MSTVNKQYFINLMQARKLSLRGLAKRMDMNHSQLSLTLSGQRRMQLDEAAKMSQIFGVPLHEIVTASGIESRPASGKRVSIIGYVSGDGSVQIHKHDVMERTESVGTLPDDAVAIQFRTAASMLEWTDAWVAFFVPRETVAPECIGRFSICQMKDGTVAVATLKRGYQEGSYNLSGPFTRENVELVWASPLLVCRF